MSVLILPQRFRQQPQFDAPLHKDWLAQGLVIACNPAIGAYNQVAASNGAVTNVGGMSTSITPTGKSWQGGSGKYIDFGSGFAAGSAGMTALQVVNQSPLVINAFSWASRASASAEGIELLIGEGGVPGRAQARMATNNTATLAINGLNDGADHTLVVRYTPSTELKLWADRLSRSGATTFNVPATSSTTQNLRLHGRAAVSYPGTSGLFLYFNRPESDYYVAALLESPYIVYRARPRRIFAVSSGGATHNLTAASATQTNVASTAAVTQGHLLAGANAAQANTGVAAAITQTHVIAVQTSAQPNVASAGVITQVHALTGAGGIQGNTGTAGAVSQTHALSVSGSVQANVASTGAITVGATHNLVAAAATQANIAAPGAISQVHALVGVGGTQTNTGSSAAVSQLHVLSAAGSTQANAASVGAVTVGVVHVLAASPSTQTNAGASGAISQAHVLVCPASVQDNIAAASAIVQTHILMGASSTQSNAASTGAVEQHSGIPPVDGPAGSGPRLRAPHGHRPAMRNTSRPRQLR